MAKYLIKVEQVEGTIDPEFKEAYGAGFDCDGFLIISKREDGGTHVAIHELNLLDLAACIKADKHLNNAAKFVSITDKLDFLKGDDNDD